MTQDKPTYCDIKQQILLDLGGSASDMTLLDYFAGQAMTGMIATHGGYNDEDLAVQSYRVAKAMLKARKECV